MTWLYIIGTGYLLIMTLAFAVIANWRSVKWHMTLTPTYKIPFPKGDAISGCYETRTVWIPWFEQNCGVLYKDWDIAYKSDLMKYEQPPVQIKIKRNHKEVMAWFILSGICTADNKTG